MFTGSLVAIVTPMKASGEIDYDSFSRLIDWHIDSGSDGLVVLGTTGESVTIDGDERANLIRHAIKQVAGRLPVIVGTGANATNHAIAFTQQAMELGADAALLVTPYYNKPTQDGLVAHFKAVAEAVPIPQILYNVPSRTACDLLPETALRLADCANIVALKEATGDIGRVSQLKAADLDLLSGDDGTAMEFMLAGGKGVISVVANVIPKAFHDLCAAAIKGDRQLAEQINSKLQALYKQLFIESNPIPTKWALAKMGLMPDGIRLPLTPLNKKYHDDVQQAMQQVGITI